MSRIKKSVLRIAARPPTIFFGLCPLEEIELNANYLTAQGNYLPVVGSIVWSRNRDLEGATTGSFRGCQMEGCRGTRIGVRWPDGKITWPCMKGMILHDNGIWEIL